MSARPHRQRCGCAWCRLTPALDDLADWCLNEEGRRRAAENALVSVYATGINANSEDVRLWTREWGEHFRDVLSDEPPRAADSAIGPEKDVV